MDIFARGSGIADIEEAIPFRFICNEFWKSRSQSIQRCIWILQRTLEIGSPYQVLPNPPFLCHASLEYLASQISTQKKSMKNNFLFEKSHKPQTCLMNLKGLGLGLRRKNSEWLLAVTFALISTQLHVNHYHIRPSWFATTFASLKHSTERRGQLWK